MRAGRLSSLARPWLLPLVPVYGAVLGAKAWMQERGWLRRRRLGRPVISVGSVSAGGAGKTPVVLLLAELLGQAGCSVRILSRGYGRASTAVERVDPAGEAARYGDEPMLLARRLEAPAEVWVGADRYAAGMAAGGGGCGVVYLLDDGFQHRKLARDLDVVLLTQADVEDCLLPAGNLREPLRALRRADVVVLREEDAGLAGFVAEVCRGKVPEVWVIRRRLASASLPARPVVFSGIARPESFVGMLGGGGVYGGGGGAVSRSPSVYGGGCRAAGGGGKGERGGWVCDDGEGCGEAVGGDAAEAGGGGGAGAAGGVGGRGGGDGAAAAGGLFLGRTDICWSLRRWRQQRRHSSGRLELNCEGRSRLAS